MKWDRFDIHTEITIRDHLEARNVVLFGPTTPATSTTAATSISKL